MGLEGLGRGYNPERKMLNPEADIENIRKGETTEIENPNYSEAFDFDYKKSSEAITNNAKAAIEAANKVIKNYMIEHAEDFVQEVNEYAKQDYYGNAKYTGEYKGKLYYRVLPDETETQISYPVYVTFDYLASALNDKSLDLIYDKNNEITDMFTNKTE